MKLLKQVNTIEGLELCHSYYMVHSDGDIYGKNGKKLFPCTDGCGYPVVHLYGPNGYVYKSISIHRIVAKAFISNPMRNPSVNHIDGVKTNNHIDNLEWLTYSENLQHSYDIGLRSAKHNARLNPSQVIIIRDMLERKFTSRQISNFIGCSVSAVKKIRQQRCFNNIVRNEKGEIINTNNNKLLHLANGLPVDTEVIQYEKAN